MSPLLAAALLAQAPALAGDSTAWERVSGEAGSASFIDPASLRREGGTALVRSRFDYPEGSLERGARTLVVNTRFDCRARTFSMRRIEGYGADGRLIQAADFAADHPQAAAHPVTAHESPVYRRVCGGSVDD